MFGITRLFIKPIALWAVLLSPLVGSAPVFIIQPANQLHYWESVGSAMSYFDLADLSLAIDGNDNLYLGYHIGRGSMDAGQAEVLKLSGTTWSVFDSVNLPPYAMQTMLAIGAGNKPYLICLEEDQYTNTNQVSLYYKDLINAGWNRLQGINSSNSYYLNPNIAFDSSGIPYVAFYEDPIVAGITVEKNPTHTPMNWSVVGSTGFNGTDGDAYVGLALDSTDTPYVLYSTWFDAEYVYKPTVALYNGSSWETVGIPGFSQAAAYDAVLTIDGMQRPCVVYADAAERNETTLMCYKSGSWGAVGIAGFSGVATRATDIALDGMDRLHVAFIDTDNGSRVAVMRYDDINTSWEYLGDEPVDLYPAAYPSLTFDSNDTVYIAYQNLGENQPTVKKLVTGYRVEVDENSLTVIDIDAFDGEGDTIIYAIGGTDAAVLEIDGSTGELTFVVSPDYESPMDSNGDNRYEITVTATANGDSTTRKLIVTVKDADEAPLFHFTLENRMAHWSYVGDPGFTLQGIESVAIAFDSSNLPYIGFADHNSENRATVMRFINNSWEAVGRKGFTPKAATFISLMLDLEENVLIAYSDESEGFKISAMHYDGTSGWNRLGASGFSTAQAEQVTIVQALYGDYFAAFSDQGLGNKAVLMHFEQGSNSWNTYGEASVSSGGADYVSLVADPSFDRTLYIAYRDATSHKATLKKVDDTEFLSTIGSEGFSPGNAEFIGVAVASNHTPYVAFRDGANGDRVTVMYYESSWQTLGTPGFSPGSVGTALSLTLDGNDTVYVAYNDANLSNRTVVMHYRDNNWSIVGERGFSDGVAWELGLAIDGNGIPYVLFPDGSRMAKASVMRTEQHYHFLVTENTQAVGEVNATDPNGDTVSYSIEGIDSSFFSIGEANGSLAFINAPDYENPLDDDSDNSYELNVTASDGINSTVKIVQVIVANEVDSDGDGVDDSLDACPGYDDNNDSDGDGLAHGCDLDDNDGPTGDLDGDGVNNTDDSNDNDGPDGDWDGDGIPNDQDLDDTDGATSESVRYEQGTENSIPGNITLRTRFLDDKCADCIQGTQTIDPSVQSSVLSLGLPDNSCDGGEHPEQGAYGTCSVIPGCTDTDADNYFVEAYCGTLQDCNDTISTIHPNANEVCNGVDDDCDGSIDEELTTPSCTNQQGVCSGSQKICEAENGWQECDYLGILDYETNETLCDGKDNDCDGQVDEGAC